MLENDAVVIGQSFQQFLTRRAARVAGQYFDQGGRSRVAHVLTELDAPGGVYENPRIPEKIAHPNAQLGGPLAFARLFLMVADQGIGSHRGIAVDRAGGV